MEAFTELDASRNGNGYAVPRLSVRRGDCGVYEQQVDGRPVLSAMVVLGDHSAVGKGENGIVRVDVSRLRSTFAIGEL